MKTIITTVVLAFGAIMMSISVPAQNIAGFTRALAEPDSVFGASVTVVDHGNAASIVAKYDESQHPQTVQGYRIRIFFDNSQNARAAALETQEKFSKQFPDIPSYVGYENPYFKVTVGNCMNMDEALILWSKVKGKFNRAFVMREVIPIAEFTKEPDLPAETSLSTANAQQ